MGKEIDCLQRIKPRARTQSGSLSKPNLLKELAKNWSLFKEDGHILLTLRTPTSIATLICRGFKCSGNSYGDFIKHMRKDGLIKRDGDSLKVYSMQGVVWVEGNKTEGTFNSGQHILVSLNSKRKKALHKIRKSQ
eukprot:TRINITY_DN4925_c0_g1_i5.p1 TRINITY_DN4925_c0_g1~~TRINITY_DN4925_c0_g1_i5.p1  ORF type:complete len:135 (+),score=9.79 TRINITY_DN4925_c0_g1_i5:185-589(+)